MQKSSILDLSPSCILNMSTQEEVIETPVTKRVPHDKQVATEVIGIPAPGVDLGRDVEMYEAMGLLTKQEVNDFKMYCAAGNKK